MSNYNISSSRKIFDNEKNSQFNFSINNLRTTKNFKIENKINKTLDFNKFLYSKNFGKNILDKMKSQVNFKVSKNSNNNFNKKKRNKYNVFSNEIKININKNLLSFQNFEYKKQQRKKIKNNLFNYIKTFKRNQIRIINDDNLIKLNEVKIKEQEEKLKKKEIYKKYVNEEKEFILKIDYICNKLSEQISKIKQIKLNKFIISKYILKKMENSINAEKFEILLHIFFYHNNKLKNDLTVKNISGYLFLRGKNFFLKRKNPKLSDDLREYVYSKNNKFNGVQFLLNLIKNNVLNSNKLVLTSYYELSHLFENILFDFKKQFFINLNKKDYKFNIKSKSKEAFKCLSYSNLIKNNKINEIEEKQKSYQKYFLKKENLSKVNNKVKNKIEVMKTRNIHLNRINHRLLNFNYTLRGILDKYRNIVIE